MLSWSSHGPRALGLVAALALSLVAPRPTTARRARVPPLVDVQRLIPTIKVDLRYASRRNIFKRRLYRGDRALLRRPVALRLARVQRHLRRKGKGLLIWDAYRPASVQKKLWRALPDPRYVAPPGRGSDHSRGAAVDVTLVELASGAQLPMPTDHDVVGPRAHRGARRGVSRRARRNAALLDRAMRRAGFRPLRTEWWHFSAPEAKRYPLSDKPLPRGSTATRSTP